MSLSFQKTSFCYIKPKRIGANEGSNTLTTTTGSREQPSTLKESDYQKLERGGTFEKGEREGEENQPANLVTVHRYRSKNHGFQNLTIIIHKVERPNRSSATKHKPYFPSFTL